MSVFLTVLAVVGVAFISVGVARPGGKFYSSCIIYFTYGKVDVANQKVTVGCDGRRLILKTLNV